MTVTDLATLPIWSTGFVIGYQDEAITIYFLTSRPQLSSPRTNHAPESVEAPPESLPVIHAAVTVSHTTAESLRDSLSVAIADAQESSAEGEDAP